MYTLTKGNLTIQLCEPGEYYQGTRFDHAGIFRKIVKDDYIYADEWFLQYNPQAHDAVCGPSEEFVTVSFNGIEPGREFVKIGVGLLRRPDNQPYDWFRLYEIADHGKWTILQDEDKITFIHEIPNFYLYTKEIELTSDSTFSIHHTLEWRNSLPLEGHTYNHNFFTFNNTPVGPNRMVVFPFTPMGHWRTIYDNVTLEGNTLKFLSPIIKTPSVYMGDLHNLNHPSTPYSAIVKEKNKSVTIEGSSDVSHYVFWSNPQVACIEPYTPISLRQGEIKNWTINYTLK